MNAVSKVQNMLQNNSHFRVFLRWASDFNIAKFRFPRGISDQTRKDDNGKRMNLGTKLT